MEADDLLAAMQAAAVAGPCTAERDGHEVAEWSDAIPVHFGEQLHLTLARRGSFHLQSATHQS